MANKKNKRNSKLNTHRHAYAKKVLPGKVKRVVKKKAVTRNQKSVLQLQGSRVVDLENLQQYTDDRHQHSAACKGSINFTSERRDGLASVFGGECSECLTDFSFETSKKVKGPQG